MKRAEMRRKKYMTRKEIKEMKKRWREALVTPTKPLHDPVPLGEIMDAYLEGKELYEDCISRADAINALGYDISIESDGGLDEYKSVIKEMLCKIYDVQKANIEKLPSVTPQPKMGHWIEKDGFDGDTYYNCSECGESWTTIEGTPWSNGMKFCPNCGAKMESEDRNEQ